MSGLFPKKGNDVQATSRAIQKGGSAGSLFGGKSSSSVAPSSNNAITVIAGDANNPQTRVLEILGRGTTEITGTQNGTTTTVTIEAGQGLQGGHIVMAYQDSATPPSLPLPGQVVWEPGEPGTLGRLTGPDAGDWSLLQSNAVPSGEQRYAIIGYYDPAVTSDIRTWLRVSQETVDGKSLVVGNVATNSVPFTDDASVTITQSGETLDFIFNIPEGRVPDIISGTTTDTDYSGTGSVTIREVNDHEYAYDVRLRAGPTGPKGDAGDIGEFRSFKTVLDTDTDTVMVDTDYDAGSNIVFVNGVFLDTDEYTFTAPRTFVFNPSLYNGDDITIQNGTTGGPAGPVGTFTAGYGINVVDTTISVDNSTFRDTEWLEANTLKNAELSDNNNRLTITKGNDETVVFEDDDTTYSIAWTEQGRKLVLIGSDGSRDSEVIGDANTTYTFTNGIAGTFTVSSSDGGVPQVVSVGMSDLIAGYGIDTDGSTWNVDTEVIADTDWVKMNFGQNLPNAPDTDTTTKHYELQVDSDGPIAWVEVTSDSSLTAGNGINISADDEISVDTDVIADTDWVDSEFVKKDSSNVGEDTFVGIYKIEPETNGDPVLADFTGHTRLILQY